MTQPETYVSTKEIKGAVLGRETDVLDGLGIEWRKAHPHIDCPYPSHTGSGADDWRWDDRKKRAFCTCNDPGHADTIFDVVAKCEGLSEFEVAKVRVAELAGRPDLIKTKGGKGQRHDAESLLHPPAEQCAPDLPRIYLAHRLGVAPADAPMPTTPATGFKALSYFDAPPKQGGKPVLVGDYPAAIFGQVGADGRRHAHRIYLAPGGEGKADLGRREDGRDRDPKKSARIFDGDNTNGRAVLWGDPSAAEHIILCEGIETAAAIAYAYRASVADGSVAVASAITAGGVEAFLLYPATKRVTVAADRDEKVLPSKPVPSRRGEMAAREFGLRNHETVAVAIALPGRPDTKTDWLDVLRTDGVEAVQTGLERATSFRPTQDELLTFSERQNALSELEQVATTYPLPDLYGMPLTYDRHAGEVWAHKRVLVGKGDDREEIRVPVFTPFGAQARLRYADDDENYGLRLAVQDMAHRPRLLEIARADLPKLGGSEARSALFGAGLRTMDDGDKIVVDCLKAVLPEREILVVRKPGWHEVVGLDAPVFACPSGHMLGLPDGHALELAISAQLAPSVAQGGTLQGWKDAVAVAAGVAGCQHWTLGVMAAFAGPLVSLTGLDSCGINLSGLSSAGKTTAQRLAASAWSKPVTDRDSLFQSIKATVNSVEAMASRANGTVLVLDELAHVSGKEVGKVIYTLASGTGKKRMKPDATVRNSYTWDTFAVLSAETSLEEKVRKDGGEWTAGQTVRMADIDVTGVDRTVSQDVLSKIGGIKTNYGHAGPAFIEGILAAGMHRDPQAIRDGVNDLAQRIAKAGGAGNAQDAATIRAANVFALLAMAGGMAQQFGLIPASANVNGIVRWAWDRFQSSTDAVALDPEQQAVANIQTWVAERWGVTIHDLDSDNRQTREAVGWFDPEAVYLPANRLAEAAGGTLKEVEVAKVLKTGGFLHRIKSEKHTYINHVPRFGPLKAYALSRDRIGRKGTSGFRVVNGGQQ